MIHDVSEKILARMQYLEEEDRIDRENETPRLERLRQIPPETGQFLYLLAMMAPEGQFIEIGTSAGYSTLWLILACRKRESLITTFEVLPEKIKLAQETFYLTQTSKYVELIEGDARVYLPDMKNISFCFLDAEKEVYEECYDLIIPQLVTGGLLIADNAINHRETLQLMLDKALSDKRVDALIVPIGKGELVCRKK
ncbi:MAG: O-methyltransferase [Candidatus Heimdallarchaeota archaeon]|nr:O-methyltransferase [Candidatus Heimdallarchaeota archaeon]